MKKKIVFYYPNLSMGGIETAMINLAKRLYKNYDLFFFYRMVSSIEVTKELSKLGLCRNISVPQADFECDTLIHCSMIKNEDEEKLINFIKPKQQILWFHALIMTQKNNKFFDSVFMNKIDCVVGVSEAAMLTLPRNNRTIQQKKKIYQKINNIVDVASIINQSEEKCELMTAKDLNICTVARISQEKGWHRIKILCDELRKLKIDFKWFIVGYEYSGGEVTRIKNLLASTPEIEWLGGTPNPFKIIKQMDYSALLSDFESWGMSITEAKILGIPPIVTDFVAAKEQVTNENGIIVPMKNYGLYNYVAKKINDNKGSYKKELESFNYEAVNDESVNAWRLILDGKINKNL